MSTELAEFHRPAAMQQVLTQQMAIRSIVKQYIETCMVVDVDYGVIPGTVNPTLLQPGAEKTSEIFRCIPRYAQTKCVEDWDSGLFHYEYKCEFISLDSDRVAAEGVGSCNSREKKYRWRNDVRKCPLCGAGAICKSKFPPRGTNRPPGFYCYDKKGGCGAEFDVNDKTVTEQEIGIRENPDIADCVNTVLKIAKKRSLVDAAAVLLRRYGFNYSIDMEDMVDHDHEPPRKEPPKSAPPKAEPPKSTPKEEPKANPPKAAAPTQAPAATTNTPAAAPAPTTATTDTKASAPAKEPEQVPFDDSQIEIDKNTAKCIELGLTDLGLSWTAQVKKRCEQIIGRPIGTGEKIIHLKESEGQKILKFISDAVSEKKK